jgi:hypothetical protein
MLNGIIMCAIIIATNDKSRLNTGIFVEPKSVHDTVTILLMKSYMAATRVFLH